MSLKKFLVVAGVGALLMAAFLLMPHGVWADLDNLPAHPLIVHGVIVMIPVLAVWMLLVAWKPNMLRKTFIPMWALSVIAALGVIMARSSGNSLAAAVGLPNAHADAGNRMIPVAIAMAASILVMALFGLVKPIRPAMLGGRAVAVVLALVALPLTYLAGHSGAESVWEEQYARAQEPISREDLRLTMAEVARRNTPDECWTVVDGIVYDMTTFIARHPAGASDIKEMCGEDGSEDFLDEHKDQGEPEKWLSTLRIGVLAD
jgi:hypothetical protein